MKPGVEVAAFAYHDCGKVVAWMAFDAFGKRALGRELQKWAKTDHVARIEIGPDVRTLPFCRCDLSANSPENPDSSSLAAAVERVSLAAAVEG